MNHLFIVDHVVGLLLYPIERVTIAKNFCLFLVYSVTSNEHRSIYADTTTTKVPPFESSLNTMY